MWCCRWVGWGSGCSCVCEGTGRVLLFIFLHNLKAAILQFYRVLHLNFESNFEFQNDQCFFKFEN
jgi:hypothetical protein